MRPRASSRRTDGTPTGLHGVAPGRGPRFSASDPETVIDKSKFSDARANVQSHAQCSRICHDFPCWDAFCCPISAPHIRRWHLVVFVTLRLPAGRLIFRAVPHHPPTPRSTDCSGPRETRNCALTTAAGHRAAGSAGYAQRVGNKGTMPGRREAREMPAGDGGRGRGNFFSATIRACASRVRRTTYRHPRRLPAG